MHGIRTQRSPRYDGAAPFAGAAFRAFPGRGPASLPAVILGVLIGLVPVAARAQTPAGTPIANTATAVFGAGDQEGLTAASNTAAVTVTAVRTPADLAFLRLAPGGAATAALDLPTTAYSETGTELGPFVPLPDPVAGGPVDLAVGTAFHQNDPVVLRVEDPDQDLDPNTAETVLVAVAAAATDEREWLRLTETGPATGVFAGAIQAAGGTAAVKGDGVLTVTAGAELVARYQDPRTPTDEAIGRALVDPLGLVFAADSGAPVDGARVTLVDAATGGPATVYGDDGVSPFPATVTSGGTVTDQGGAAYAFPAGGYRFPVVAPGSYRLQVHPPAGWLAPSRAATADLQTLPGAPFALDEAASRGGAFTVDGTVPLRVDLPVDPAGGTLFLAKRAGKTTTAVGEWVPWDLRLANTGQEDAAAVTVEDRLPPRFRFEPGSLRLDGAPAPDPLLSPDGRTLTVALDSLAAGAAVTIRYATAVLVGASAGQATNTARAWHAGLASNAASASVLVQDDLFADRCLLVGRVIEDDCAAAAADSATGVPGVRLYLEDGTSVVTDARGRYHLEAVRPGAHVLQLDKATLPGRLAAGACAPEPRRAEHPFARMLDLQAGTTWRVDFPVHEVDPDTGAVSLDLAVTLDGRDLAGVLALTADRVPLRNVRPTVMLPDGVSYRPGSARLDGEPAPDPEDRGGVLIWRLGDVAAGWHGALAFGAAVDTVQRADLVTSALVVADGPAAANLRAGPAQAVVSLVPEQVRRRNPEIVLRPRFASLAADLDSLDLAEVDSLAAGLVRHHVLAVRVVGHTDSQGIPAGKRRVFRDNYALGLARAQAVADRLARTLRLEDGQLHVYSRGPDEPVADNATAEGRAHNRRVVVQAWTEDVSHRLPDHPVRDRAAAALPVVGLPPGESWERPAAPGADPDVMPVYDMAWLDGQQPGFALLWPPEGYHPAIPSLKVAAKHDPAHRLTLEVNGAPLDRLNFDGTARDAANRVAVTRWAGVDLKEGDNRLVVTARDSAGVVVTWAERTVHVSGPPVRAELVPERSRLAAGGRTPPVLAVRLLDRDGHPARRGVTGEFDVDAPYEPLRARSEHEKARLAALAQTGNTYTVGPDGIAEITLEPTTRTGEVHLRLPLAGRREELRAWLEPEPRDWILVGLAEGTAGWSAVSGNLQGLDESGEDDGFHQDGRLAFFARGRVKGKWLLTAAFDSRRKGDAPADRALGGVIDPDALYTVYGDASVQGQDAPTTGKLYVRLERRAFYALWGDYTTGLTVTELGRYNRKLTGGRAGWRDGPWDVTAFASDRGQSYGRDELRGDGTSGIYRLSRGDLLIGSETVTIEVRDRFRPEVVLSSRRLTRTVDYDLDYLRGELVFKEAIFSRDDELNPVWIVAEYETTAAGADAVTAGGRAAVHLRGDKIETGVTVLHEGAPGADGDLAAVDARVDLAPGVTVKAEAAGSDRADVGRAGAWLAEVAARSPQVDTRVWARRREQDFGLGQQRRAEAGTFTAGAETAWRFRPGWTLGSRLARREDLKTAAAQDLADTRLAWNRGAFSADLGHRWAQDRFASSPDRLTRQVRVGASAALLRGRLRLKAAHEHDLGAGPASADFPTRTSAGAEVEVVRNATLLLRQEWTDADGHDTRSTRVGMRSTPWAGGEVQSSVEQQHREGDLRVWKNAGIKQTWQISPRWSVDGGLDHARVQGAAPPTVDTGSVTSGGPTEGYTAVSAGAICRGRNWRWTQRAEVRHGDTEDKWSLDGAVFVEPSGSLGLQAGLRLDRRDGAAGTRSDRTAARLGLAWRPERSPWTVLQRLDWKIDDDASTAGALESRRLVQNLTASWQGRPWLQVSGRYGWRWAVETIDGATYRGWTDVAGLEGRWFFARRWDLGLQGAARNSWHGGVHDLSVGASVGLKLLEDLWLSAGYNLRGFRDRDFDAAGWTAQGPYLRFRFRFNQESSREQMF